MVRSPLTGPDIEIEVLITVKTYPPSVDDVRRKRLHCGNQTRHADAAVVPPLPRRLPGVAEGAAVPQVRRRPLHREAARLDPRPESLCPIVDTIEVVGSLPSWPDRWLHLKPLALNSMCELRELNAAGTPTAHGGARWWPSTVRAVLDRVSA